jgi:creatinine amidohydrolase
MIAQFGRLRRALFGALGKLVQRCAGMSRRPPQPAIRGGRRSFLQAVSGVLGFGGAAAPALLMADEKPPPNKGGRPQLWEELTATDLVEALRQRSLAYVPIGTLEFHGPHLPLGTDAIHAYEFCLAAAERLGGVVLPPIYFSPHGSHRPGSLMIREETFRVLLTDVFTLLCQHGIELIVASTGHFPKKQEPAIRQIADEVGRQFPKTRVVVLGPWCHPTDRWPDHGGKMETSLMLALRPNLVHMERLAGERALEGIASSAVEGSTAFGKAYFQAGLENFVGSIKKTR